MKMNLVCILVVAVLLPCMVIAHRQCMEDTDCDELGHLYCIKSACDRGICGCLRGYASRYVGSEETFQCVPLKKVGESCDTKGTGGVCAAINSYCDDDKCVCPTGKEARWGGEACFDIKTNLFPSESFSGGIGSCVATDYAGMTVSGMSGLGWASLLEDANKADVANYRFDNVPNICACGTGFRTTLPNDFDSSPYMGRKAPTCTPIAVGDSCIDDIDCINIEENDNGVYVAGGGMCDNNVCACSNANHVPDITGMYCNTGLNYGADCAWSNAQNGQAVAGVCDGSQGLRCGDICDVTEWFSATSFNHTCACDPSYSDNGGTCTAVGEGDACNGDFNCKSLSRNAICEDGTCQNGATTLTVAGSILAAILLQLAILVL